MLRSILFTFLTILVLNGVLALFVDLVDQIKYQPKIKKWQSDQKRKLANLKKDDQFYQRHSLFLREPVTGSDFNPYFRDHFSQRELLLNAQDRQKILALGRLWLEKKILIKDISPINEFFSKSGDYNFWSIKESELKTLSFSPMDWVVMGQALMSVARWNQESNPAVTAKSVRHFSRLLLSTEHFDMNRAALSLLEKEIDFTNGRLVQVSEINKDHQPLKKEEVRRIVKYFDRLSSLLSPISSPESLKYFIDHPKLPIGFCSAYFKKRDFFSWSAPYLKKKFLFETSYQQQFKLWDELKDKAQQHCISYEPENEIKNHSWIRILPFYRRIYSQNRLLSQEGLIL